MFNLFFLYNGHRIEAHREFPVAETIFFDGTEVSSGKSFWGSTHLFVIQEDGAPIQYEVTFKRKRRCTVKRNGVLLLETAGDKSEREDT